MIRFRYQCEPRWPPLAWLAACEDDSPEIVVRHGRDVATHNEWFDEAVWAGPYDAGNLDHTDTVFGSGARIRGDQVVFVSSASTVDRLQSFTYLGGVLVSNSLPCIMTAAALRLRPRYPNYPRDLRTIIRGLRHYRRRLTTNEGPIHFTYYDNLCWNGRTLVPEPKPVVHRPLDSFEQYRTFLDTSLAAIVANMTHPARSRRYQLLGTMSSGYDSTTVAVLGKSHGLRDVLSFERYDLDPDSGAPLARRLGLGVVRVPRDRWRDDSQPEVPFLAADAKGEDVYFTGAERHLAGRVLLTGFHGDKVWDRDTKVLGPEIVRGDQSGLSLSEYRLHSGFIHCPVPFLGVRQIRDINAISRSEALRPWDVPGRYSRPICRRIVEEAGIPRTSFGTHKRVASVLFFDRTTFLTPSSLADYRRWLSTVPEESTRSAIERRVTTTLVHPILGRAARTLDVIRAHSPEPVGRLLHVVATRLGSLTRREHLFRYLMPWAMERAKLAYQPHGAGIQTQRRSLPRVQQGASQVG